MEIPCFNELIEKSIIKNWDNDAITDYHSSTLQYHDVARKIEKLHIMFENSGVVRGDKIALCGRNSSGWAAAFLATLTYGAVAVPILHEFTAEQIHNIVNHSEAKLLFVGDVVATIIDPTKMKEQSPDELALINYTSGTTGFSKGVMIPYRALWSNYDFAMREMGDKYVTAGCNTLSILPMAHMYGMAFEFIFEFIHGCHIFFLTRVPSPAIIAQAFADIKPAIVIAVPLIIEKIIKKRVFPKIQGNLMRLLLGMPVINKMVNQKICEEVTTAFGGNFYEVIVGGAAFNQEVESFMRQIEFPYTVGYGATECAPIICYADWKYFVPGSCGKAALHMEVHIDSPDPENIPGEILCRGLNVMLGYYKNPEATAECIDKNGWFHTGDLGTMDADGNVFIKGRSKNMLLGANGQNIYPEEIEDKLNSLVLVAESVVVQRDEKLVGIVFPDFDEAKSMGLTRVELERMMEQNRIDLNAQMPAYSKISAIEIREEEFAKTPKKSIKRYLYT